MRITDASLLLGDPDVLTYAKAALVEEWTGKDGTHILNRIKNRQRNFDRVIRDGGTQRFNRHTVVCNYSLDRGLALYNPDKKQLSFKPGPLRLVQFAINRNLIAYCRSDSRVGLALLGRMPTNTGECVYFLEAEGLLTLPHEKTSELVDSYHYFLWQYHRSQEAFHRNGLDAIAFDQREARERIAGLVSIVSKPLLKGRSKK